MIDSYFEEIILKLSEVAYVNSFAVIKKKTTSTDGYLRIKADITSNDILEISIYCQCIGMSVEVIDYRYHWQDKNGLLKRRWDNCKHHKGIRTFPFHVHVEKDEIVEPSEKMDIYKVIEMVGKNI